MKLTQNHRIAFVRGIMRDTPAVDYDQIAHDIVEDYVEMKTPEDYKAVRDKYPGAFSTSYIWTPPPLSDVAVKSPFGRSEIGIDRVDDQEIMPTLQQLASDAKAQAERRNALECSLLGAINSCTTLEKALELFPEFAAYLPTKEEPTRNLPARNIPARNIVQDLKAAGWPSGATNASKEI